MKFLPYYLLTINALTLLIMLADKRKAQKGAWRIPERVLLCLALAGGSLGGVMGMRLFRHKTQHPKFALGLPLLLALHIFLLILLL